MKTRLFYLFLLVLLSAGCMSPNHSNFRSPSQSSKYVEKGIASWYGLAYQFRKTASGERFNTYNYTAAHKKLPFNTYVKVTNLTNNKSVIVRINDRGPFVKGRIIDLTRAAAKKIDMIKKGTARVRIEVVKKT